MSTENVELVLSLQLGARQDAATLASDPDATAAYLESVARALDPDFECTMRFPGLSPVVYRGGLHALRSAWTDRLRHWSEYRAEIEGVIDADSRIVVFHRAHVRRTPSAPESVLEVAGVWTVREGRLVSADFNVPHVEARAIAYSTAA